MDMYSILRIQYVHITPDSIVQYTPKYSPLCPFCPPLIPLRLLGKAGFLLYQSLDGGLLLLLLLLFKRPFSSVTSALSAVFSWRRILFSFSKTSNCWTRKVNSSTFLIKSRMTLSLSKPFFPKDSLDFD